MPEDENKDKTQANGDRGKGISSNNNPNPPARPEEDLPPADRPSPAADSPPSAFEPGRSRKKARRSKKSGVGKRQSSGFAFAATREKTKEKREEVWQADADHNQGPTAKNRQDKQQKTEAEAQAPAEGETAETGVERKKPKGVFAAFFAFKNKRAPKYEHHTTLAVREQHEVTSKPVADRASAEPDGPLGGETTLSSPEKHKALPEHEPELLLAAAETKTVKNPPPAKNNEQSEEAAAESDSENTGKMTCLLRQMAFWGKRPVAPAQKGTKSNPKVIFAARKQPKQQADFVEPEDTPIAGKVDTPPEPQQEKATATTVDSSRKPEKRAGFLQKFGFGKKQKSPTTQTPASTDATSGKVILAIRKPATTEAAPAAPVITPTENENSFHEVAAVFAKHAANSPPKLIFADHSASNIPSQKPAKSRLLGGLFKQRNDTGDPPEQRVADDHLKTGKIIFATRTNQPAPTALPQDDQEDRSAPEQQPLVVEETSAEHIIGVEHFDDTTSPTPKKASFWRFGKKDTATAEAEPVAAAETSEQPEDDFAAEVDEREVKLLLAETERSEEELAERSSATILKDYAEQEEELALQNMLLETERLENSAEAPTSSEKPAAARSFFGFQLKKPAEQNEESTGTVIETELDDHNETAPEESSEDAPKKAESIESIPPGAETNESERLMLESPRTLLLEMPKSDQNQNESDSDSASEQVSGEETAGTETRAPKKRRGFLQLFAGKTRSVAETEANTPAEATAETITESGGNDNTSAVPAEKQRTGWKEKLSGLVPGLATRQDADNNTAEPDAKATDEHSVQSTKVILAIRRASDQEAPAMAAIATESTEEQTAVQIEPETALANEEDVLAPDETAPETVAEPLGTTPAKSDKEPAQKQGLLQRFSLFGKKSSGGNEKSADPIPAIGDAAAKGRSDRVIFAVRKPQEQAVEADAPMAPETASPEESVDNTPAANMEEPAEKPDPTADRSASKKLLSSAIAPFIGKKKGPRPEDTAEPVPAASETESIEASDTSDKALEQNSDEMPSTSDSEQLSPSQAQALHTDQITAATEDATTELATEEIPEATALEVTANEAPETAENPAKKGLLTKLTLPFSKQRQSVDQKSDPAVEAIAEKQPEATETDVLPTEGTAEAATAPEKDQPEQTEEGISDEMLLSIDEKSDIDDTARLEIPGTRSGTDEPETAAEEPGKKGIKLMSMFRKKKAEPENALAFLAPENGSAAENSGSAFDELFQNQTPPEKSEPVSATDPTSQLEPDANVPAPNDETTRAIGEQAPEMTKPEEVPQEQSMLAAEMAPEASLPQPEVTAQPESMAGAIDPESERNGRPDVLVRPEPVSTESGSADPQSIPEPLPEVADVKNVEPGAANTEMAGEPTPEADGGGSAILEMRALPNDEDTTQSPSLETPATQTPEIEQNLIPEAEQQQAPASDDDPLLALLPRQDLPQNEVPEQSIMPSPADTGTQAPESPAGQKAEAAFETPQQNPAEMTDEQLLASSPEMETHPGGMETSPEQQQGGKPNPFTGILNRFGLDKSPKNGEPAMGVAPPEMTGDGSAFQQAIGDGQNATDPFTQGDEKNPFVSGLVTGVQMSEKNETKVLGENFSAQLTPMMQKRQEEDKKRKKEYMMVFSKFVAGLSLLVPLASWIVFQTMLNPESNLTEILKAKNYGIELRDSEAQLAQKEKELKQYVKEVTDATKQIENIKNNKILAEITENRIDFLEIMLRINRITLKSLSLTPELNSAINMLVFNTYSGRIDSSAVGISINGTVRDPKRMSWSKLTHLMETINEDEYFSGASIRSFSKSDDDEGGSRSSFSFNFTYFPPVKEELLSAAPAK